uniref:glycosyltransferase family 2 protein n=1 Tax=Flavobacterium sp. TaxID=239 RepID=UPI004047A069
MKLSIVSPVYRAELVLDELVERISNNIPSAFSSFEIILVDDFSPDKSWDKIVEISNNNSNVRGFKLSRNFGQHYAITAGLNQTTGDYIVVLDCDLQDQPEEIEKLFNASQNGFDIVLARRYERKDSLYKKTVSKLFYKTLSYLTGTKQDATVANFGIYSRQVINEVVKLEEKIKYFPTMVKWVGFSTTYVNVEHASRSEGKSNYNLKKLLNLALDIILAYSDKPLRLIIKFGLSIALISFLMVIYVLFEKFTGKVSVSGYASLIISIWFLINRIMFC